MALPVYLAMTATEFAAAESLPKYTAWMACHFSCSGTGLSNIPQHLPVGSMLIVDDSTPIHKHDPKQIADQLAQVIDTFSVEALLLDLQRPVTDAAFSMINEICNCLKCPVGIPPPYLQSADCPVFLPPIPLDIPPEEYLKPYAGKAIWLELALDGATITVTAEDSRYAPLLQNDAAAPYFIDEQLHCAYRISIADDRATFTLWRTPETLESLKEAVSVQGVNCGIGLYQELAKNPRL